MELSKHGQRAIVSSFFHSHPLAYLATLSEMHTPETASVYVYMEPDFTCYFFTKEKTRKYLNILRNPKVALSVGDEQSLSFGEITGNASVVVDSEILLKIMPKLQTVIASRKNTYWVPPIAQLQAGGFALFEVTPEQVRFTGFENTITNPEPHHIILNQSDLAA